MSFSTNVISPVPTASRPAPATSGMPASLENWQTLPVWSQNALRNGEMARTFDMLTQLLVYHPEMHEELEKLGQAINLDYCDLELSRNEINKALQKAENVVEGVTGQLAEKNQLMLRLLKTNYNLRHANMVAREHEFNCLRSYQDLLVELRLATDLNIHIRQAWNTATVFDQFPATLSKEIEAGDYHVRNQQNLQKEERNLKNSERKFQFGALQLANREGAMWRELAEQLIREKHVLVIRTPDGDKRRRSI